MKMRWIKMKMRLTKISLSMSLVRILQFRDKDGQAADVPSESTRPIAHAANNARLRMTVSISGQKIQLENL